MVEIEKDAPVVNDTEMKIEIQPHSFSILLMIKAA